MGFKAVYTAIFDDLEATIKALSSIKQVIYKKEGRGVIRELPCVFINPGRWLLEPADSMNVASLNTYALDIRGTLVVLIRESDPDNWFDEIIDPISDIVDAIFADQTLGGTCDLAWPNAGGPGEVTLNNKLYYGGSIDIRTIKEYP